MANKTKPRKEVDPYELLTQEIARIRREIARCEGYVAALDFAMKLLAEDDKS